MCMRVYVWNDVSNFRITWSHQPGTGVFRQNIFHYYLTCCDPLPSVLPRVTAVAGWSHRCGRKTSNRQTMLTVPDKSTVHISLLQIMSLSRLIQYNTLPKLQNIFWTKNISLTTYESFCSNVDTTNNVLVCVVQYVIKTPGRFEESSGQIGHA